MARVAGTEREQDGRRALPALPWGRHGRRCRRLERSRILRYPEAGRDTPGAALRGRARQRNAGSAPPPEQRGVLPFKPCRAGGGLSGRPGYALQNPAPAAA